MDPSKQAPVVGEFDAATIGALAHLYRGEVYRSTIWRTRLDNTTNWAVVTLGLALSITFSNRDASALPLLLSGVLCVVFLIFEARRYRYFNVWARAGALMKNFYAPMLLGGRLGPDEDWSKVLRPTIACHAITFPSASDWTAIAAQLHLDSWHSDHCLLRQDRDRPQPNQKRFGVDRACRSGPSPRRGDALWGRAV